MAGIYNQLEDDLWNPQYAGSFQGQFQKRQDLGVAVLPDVHFNPLSNTFTPAARSGDKQRGSLDPNAYATKKTIAQGMLDIALLTSNASQLRYLLKIGDKHEFYEGMLALIIISIILQEEWKHFLDVVNYLSTVFATAIVFIDIIKIGFINFELEDMVP